MCIFVCVGSSIYSIMGIYYYSNKEDSVRNSEYQYCVEAAQSQLGYPLELNWNWGVPCLVCPSALPVIEIIFFFFDHAAGGILVLHQC